MSRRRFKQPEAKTDVVTPSAVEVVDDELGPDHQCIELPNQDATAPIDAGGTATVSSAVEECIDQPLLAENVQEPPALSNVEGPALSNVEGPALSNVEGPAATDAESVPSDPVRIVTVDLPLLRTPAYASNTLRRLEQRHAQTLRDLTDGLAHEGVKFEGRPILGTDDALAWLLDQLASATRF